MPTQEDKLKDIESELKFLVDKDIDDFGKNIRNIKTQKRINELTKQHTKIKMNKKYWK